MLWQLSETDPVPVFFLINVASDGLWGKTWSVIKQMGEMGHLILSSKYFTFISLIEKALYKIAFHGRSKHIWESLMTIKEVFISIIMIHSHGHHHHDLKQHHADLYDCQHVHHSLMLFLVEDWSTNQHDQISIYDPSLDKIVPQTFSLHIIYITHSRKAERYITW